MIVKMTILRLRHFFPKLEATVDKTQFVITNNNHLVEITMRPKSLILPECKRVLAPPFAWVDRRFLLNGFLDTLTPQENLLYFFLVLAADRDGLSFYNYDKICQVLKLDVDDYIQARNGLIDKKLIAFDGRQFQVLALPKTPIRQASSPYGGSSREREAQVLEEVLRRLSRGLAQQT
jgi:hypothetical protein